MTFSVPKPRKPLVYIEPATNYYARYIGSQCYGAFISGRPMDRYEVELFRTNPEAFVSPGEIDPMRPAA